MHPLERRRITDNESAALALISIMGGYDQFKAQGHTLTDLTGILNADPSDQLSGLRAIATGMQYSGGVSLRPSREDSHEEAPIDPETAKTWLLTDGLAIETETGLELLPTAHPDHSAIAGLIIAVGGTSRLLSEVYADVSPEGGQIADWLVAKKAKGIIETHQAVPELG